MRLKNPNDYELQGYEVATGNKKYNAILRHKRTGRIVKVGFGDKNYQHYKDKIGHYSRLNHLDPARRGLYLARHAADSGYKYSSGWFSANILW